MIDVKDLVNFLDGAGAEGDAAVGAAGEANRCSLLIQLKAD